jgi:hypothetical protein
MGSNTSVHGVVASGADVRKDRAKSAQELPDPAVFCVFEDTRLYTL